MLKEMELKKPVKAEAPEAKSEKRAADEAGERQKVGMETGKEKAHVRKEEALPKIQSREPFSQSEAVPEDFGDDLNTAAVAEIYERQGLREEALRIYELIGQKEPDNLEIQRKIKEMGGSLKSKTSRPSESSRVSSGSFGTPPPPGFSPGSEKDSNGKKKSNRIGYV